MDRVLLVSENDIDQNLRNKPTEQGVSSFLRPKLPNRPLCPFVNLSF